MDTATATPEPLAGAAVLIAGATGGIGSAVAVELDRRGAALTLVGRDQARLDQLTVPGLRLAVDLRTPEGCRQAVAAAKAEHGRLDAVVNAVGVVAFGAVADLSI
ncbi:MAG: SDR family NAD(P)-dependent oxidoreductase, partial [Actinomycetota bacterium]